MVSREGRSPVIHMKAEEYYLKSWAQKWRQIWYHESTSTQTMGRGEEANIRILEKHIWVDDFRSCCVSWRYLCHGHETEMLEPILVSRMSSLLLNDFCESIWKNSFHACFELYGFFFFLWRLVFRFQASVFCLGETNWSEPQQQELKNCSSIHFVWLVHAA